ncbi:uncharacterized protein LOC131948208 isoform X2 [Physella acuta]|uniref:uncharacterized protein LOC131948208 isoform X2 n=1 Tax=Physella acuta TaxID=109671 RepID=UPI0027DB82F7|nr:uncharacterized protein LOC131948208 isoform X2 [Physella acuta]
MLPKLPIVILVIVFLYLTYRVIPVHKLFFGGEWNSLCKKTSEDTKNADHQEKFGDLPEPNASGDQSFKHGCSMTDIGIKLMSRYLIGALSGALSVIIYAALKVSVNAITPWIVSYFPVLLFRQEERNTPVLRRRTSVGAKYFPRHYDGTSD